MTALRIQPGAHEILNPAKLQVLMPVGSTLTRTGHGGALGRELFAAYPTLEAGDTVGFVPYPTEAFARVPFTAAVGAAHRRNRALLNEFAASWADRFPRSARAQEALADALEAREELGEERPNASAALRAIDSAVSLMVTSGGNASRNADVIRLRARKVRVHFKRGEYVAARILADSILRTPAPPESGDDLQWVAALIGRADLTAHYWQRTLRSEAVTGGIVHPAVAGPASRYLSYAALGICEPQFSEARARFESALGVYLSNDIRDAVRADLALRPAILAIPCTKGKNLYGFGGARSDMIDAQRAFGRGDSARARGILVHWAAERKGRRPGDLSADFMFQEAWLRTQVGDTAAAAASLDAALGALPTFSAANFEDLAGSAAFGRAMALRAEIAAKQGDARTARRWAGALGELWASADPPLRKVVADISQLVSSGGQ